MENFDRFLDTFISGDYFLIFLVLMLIILVVLILALIKTRQDYYEILNYENKIAKNRLAENKNSEKEESQKEDNFFEALESLKASTKEEEFDMDKPLIKQIDIPSIITYEDIIDEYETSEEENAVISAEELEKRKRERMDALGANDNQIAIAAYEEEQEKKAIISYEQLLKNASNITLSYKKENNTAGSPVINKIEITQKEITAPENYLEEEEFLKILKEFRLSL